MRGVRAADEGLRAGAAPDSEDRQAHDLWLLRQYEPVLRLTQGELFLPMPVESYLRKCSLWRREAASQVCAPGEITAARLAEVGASSGDGLWLRFVASSLRRKEFRAWRRDAGRARLAPGTSRFAAVGILGRLIDAVLRLSLLLRGRVPGGTTAAAERAYRADADPGNCPYYGRVTRDRGFVVLQYWFFYAMNDWRSSFGGVNDHEADWEQVTVFLADPPDPASRPTWIAISSHDEAGDDLRRRADDPDLHWRGAHPVLFAGAGSHSGAYMPGDYLVTVEPPALGRLIGVLRRAGRLLLPWKRGQTGTRFGIPFIDYHRGDGPGVGPGEARHWLPVLVNDQTPWLRDYRGLWGLDTGDPFGGEQAPAGPRYERDGSVRLCWSDPVGWAGLDKEAPSSAVEQQVIEDRIAELDARLAVTAAELDTDADELRRARVGSRAAANAANLAAVAALAKSVEQARAWRQELAEERVALKSATVAGLPKEDPHAHLSHRAIPNVDPARARGSVLRVWSAVSASALLAGLALVILGHVGALLPAFAGLSVVMLSVEAFARGHLWQFLAGLAAAVILGAIGWLTAQAVIGNWRLAIAVLLILAAVAVLLVNVRDFFRKR